MLTQNKMTPNFEIHLDRINGFMNLLSANLDRDARETYRILKSVLHTLRDTITLQESLQLMAQLPMFLKGVYAEDWKVKSRGAKIKHISDFVEKVKDKHGKTNNTDFSAPDDVERACRIVFRSLSDFVSKGEINDIRAVLPKDIKALFDNEMILL